MDLVIKRFHLPIRIQAHFNELGSGNDPPAWCATHFVCLRELWNQIQDQCRLATAQETGYDRHGRGRHVF